MSTLVLTAHGSKDPRSAANAHAVARTVTRMRPGLDVRVAFLEQCSPSLAAVLTGLPEGREAVVSPLLLASAYHAGIDIPEQIAGCGGRFRQADALGEDSRLVAVLHQRLTERGVHRLDSDLGVLVVAVGSSNAAANARTAQVAAKLAAGSRWAAVTTAFATGPEPSVAEAASQLRRLGARRLAIAPWFLAPGLLTDRVREYAAQEGIPTAAPLGAHPLVAETVLDRYDQAVDSQAAA